jgi:hypothetical protein
VDTLVRLQEGTEPPRHPSPPAVVVQNTIVTRGSAQIARPPTTSKSRAPPRGIPFGEPSPAFPPIGSGGNDASAIPFGAASSSDRETTAHPGRAAAAPVASRQPQSVPELRAAVSRMDDRRGLAPGAAHGKRRAGEIGTCARPVSGRVRRGQVPFWLPLIVFFVSAPAEGWLRTSASWTPSSHCVRYCGRSS